MAPVRLSAPRLVLIVRLALVVLGGAGAVLSWVGGFPFLVIALGLLALVQMALLATTGAGWVLLAPEGLAIHRLGLLWRRPAVTVPWDQLIGVQVSESTFARSVVVTTDTSRRITLPMPHSPRLVPYARFDDDLEQITRWWSTRVPHPIVARDKRQPWWWFPALVAAVIAVLLFVERPWTRLSEQIDALPDPCVGIDDAAVARFLPHATVTMGGARPALTDPVAERRDCQWTVFNGPSMDVVVSRYRSTDLATQAAVPSAVPQGYEQIPVPQVPGVTFAAVVHTPDRGDLLVVVGRRANVVVTVTFRQSGTRPDQSAIDFAASVVQSELDQLPA